MSGGRYTLFRSDSIERQASLKFSKHRQYQAVLIASLAATAAGTLDGWMMMSVSISGKADYNSMAVYHFISYMFAIIGAVTFGVISDNIGRKFALIIIGIIMLPVWILYTTFANAWTVAAGLVLSGLAAGGATVAVPLYISDITDKSSRAILIVIFYQFFIAGELITFFGNPKERLTSTASFAFLIALIFVLTFIWMPESPYHLISVGREIDARKSLEFFCGDWDVDTQVALIKESTKNKKSIFDHIRDTSLRTPLLILAGLTTLSRLVAVDSFNYRLIKRHFYHNNAHLHADYEAIKFGFGVNIALQLIVMGLGAFLIQKYGRRKLLYISSFGMSMSAVPLMFAPFLSGYELILLPLLFLYIGAFSIGLATIPWILADDLFAPEHKTVSYTVNAVLFWGMASFAPERLILAVKYLSNFFGVYFLFLTIAVVLYIKSVIPETKDSRPLDIRAEIDALISRFRTRQQQTTTPADVVN